MRDVSQVLFGGFPKDFLEPVCGGLCPDAAFEAPNRSKPFE